MRKANLLVAALLVMSFAGGCGNNQQSTDTKPVVTQTQQYAQYFGTDKFTECQLGMTYDEVKQILGKEGENVGTDKYEFKVGTIGKCTMFFKDNKLTQKQIDRVPCTDKVVGSVQFNQVQEGMTYDEVKQIFGCDGQLSYQAENGSAIDWAIDMNKSVIIYFDKNGQVEDKDVEQSKH